MRKLFTFIVAVLLTAGVFAQSPEKMSYQAVIRDASDNLITDTQVGMQISILQGSASGTAVYVETQEPTTNANGLVNIEIGTGTTSDDFSAIDWADGPYFIKTETDPAGATSYSITGTSQLLSVPYALHAKTAETVIGEITETDPVFGAWDKSTGISITESQVSDLGNYIETETDPAVAANFDFSDAANGDLLQFNGTKWVKVTPDYISDYTVTESDVTAHEAALEITESQITDLGTYLETETDPAVAANFDFSDAANGDLLQFNGTKWVKVTPDYISDYTVTESDVTAHEAALEITESQITDMGTYLETETDPSVPTGNQTGDMQYWDGSEWITVQPGSTGQVLTLIDGVPTWGGVQTAGANEVQNPTTGAIWMDRNLGASQIATSSDDEDAYGDLYQWGRAADGHESRTSGITATNATTAVPNDGNSWDGLFIIIESERSFSWDWLTPQDDDLWQGVNGTNNPCPDGYRLPTEAEWENERQSWNSDDTAGAFDSPLKLPKAGVRPRDGSINYGGAFYWSSTVDGAYSRIMGFDGNEAVLFSGFRSTGSSVRCLKD